MNLDFILKRGRAANSLLINEAYQSALKEIKADYLLAWESTPIKNSEDRERIYMAVRLMNEVDGKLRQYLSEALYEQGKNP